jgi:ubiquinone/menaquinone biosynthesis C-methylase UbiE
MQQVKQERIVWSKGDFGAVAPLIWEVGRRVVERVDVQPGERVLDVACGTGNAALRAAERGAEVTGLDIVPELLEQAQVLAERDGLALRCVEGDAEALPFEDARFDAVLSVFGCMFAPDHRRAAGEIARVLRPGGRIGICAWIPDGVVGEFFGIIASYMPPPPPGFEPPPLWGVESHVREIFSGTGIEPSGERQTVHVKAGSPEELLRLYEEKFGPIVAAKEALEPQGRWDDLAAELLEFFRREMVDAGDGEVAFPSDYLLVTGTKSG